MWPQDFFFLISYHIKPAQTGCGPLKEGVSTTLTCEISCASDDSLSWKAGIDTQISTVAGCEGDDCEVLPDFSGYFSISISPTGSTLTFNSVSRSDPFNMETRWWTCQCGGSQNTVCGKLQVYGQLNSFFFYFSACRD